MKSRMVNGIRHRAWIAVIYFVLPHAGFAQPLPQPQAATSAPKLVREANELLLGDKPAEALRTYEQAQLLKPDAREIAFDQALAHYRLGEFDRAHEAFTRAAGGAADALSDDALYGLGTCDHAEALTAQDPKEAVRKIENAMRNYQNVLGNQRDHTASRDANLKAASYWRQLKQQLEQQQQQQNQDQKNEEKNEDEKQDQQSKQDQQQSEQNQQEQQKQSQSQQDQQKDQEKQKEQEQQSTAQKEDRQEQKQAAEAKEDALRDQAERKLREMMQAMRDRKKHRREEAKTPTYRPTEKDW